MQFIPENQLKDYFKTHSVSTELIDGTDELTFQYNNKTNTPVILQIFNDRVEFYYKVNTSFSTYPHFILLTKDIVGTEIQQNEITRNVYLAIHAYPRKNVLTNT